MTSRYSHESNGNSTLEW